MDENNVTNQNLNNETNEETGFVMQDTPQPEVEQTPQPETQQAYQQAPQPEAQQTYQQVPPQPEAQQTYQQTPPPQENVYRFQNVDAVQASMKKKEQKKNTLPKMILFGAVFGVVAAVCFTLVTFLFGKFNNNQIESSESLEPVRVSTVSGGAVGVTDVSGIVESVMPSIVAITEKTTQTSMFGQSYSSEGAGSGFIVKQDNNQLLIVTNNHVVADADTITVQFNDGENVKAKVKGTSASNDLAVLTVDLKDMKDSTKKSIKVASLGSSDDVKVGQMVIAIGNALGYGQSVTVGYVSAKDREVSAQDSSGNTSTQILMQTDAAINPGNSGGALIDTNGNVIGINSSKYFSYGNTSVEGMGYAIPMSTAVTIINDLMDRQVLKDTEKGYLGITGINVSSDMSESYGMPVGVYVKSISDTGAAYKAGIKQGDVITKIDKVTVKTISEVQEKVNNTKVGTTIEVTVMRNQDGQYTEKTVKVTLKSKDTLNGLEDDVTEDDQNTNPYSGNNKDDSYKEIPWGGGLY